MGDRDRSCGRGFGVVPAMGLVERSGGGGFRKGSDRRTKPTSETDRGGGGMDANYEDGGARRMEAKVGRGGKKGPCEAVGSMEGKSDG